MISNTIFKIQKKVGQGKNTCSEFTKIHMTMVLKHVLGTKQLLIVAVACQHCCIVQKASKTSRTESTKIMYEHE